MHKVFLDGISENMAPLVHKYKYGDINVLNTSTMGCYVLKYVPDAFILQ